MLCWDVMAVGEMKALRPLPALLSAWGCRFGESRVFVRCFAFMDYERRTVHLYNTHAHLLPLTTHAQKSARLLHLLSSVNLCN